MNKIEEVYSIFQDFFGEDLVDLQGDIILVLFPRVTIINENGRSTDIEKLFVKVKLEYNGTLKGTFQLLRTRFSERHFRSGYVHSHVTSFGRDIDDIRVFRIPCLGTGPIRNTCASLSIEFDADIWRLFCYELSKYVTVESLSGGPYIGLETLDTRDIFTYGAGPWVPETYKLITAERDYDLYKTVTPEFTRYVLSKRVLPLSYGNRFYSIALSPYDIVITLSNLFIEWYNTLPNHKKPEKCIPKSAMWFEGKCHHGVIFKRNRYYTGQQLKPIEEYVGTPMINFKGVVQKLEIPDLIVAPNSGSEEITATLLTPGFLSDIVNRLIKIINYGLIKNTKNGSKDGSYFTYIGKDTEIIF